MNILQVRDYHSIVANTKIQEALERWKERGYGYPVKSMFFFFRSNPKVGYSTIRKNGYIAFGDKKAVFGMTKKEAAGMFQRG